MVAVLGEAVYWGWMRKVSHDSEGDSHWSEVRVNGYKRVLSCIVRYCCQAMTSEDIEDWVFAAVILNVRGLVKTLYLFAITNYKPSVNPVISLNAISSH